LNGAHLPLFRLAGTPARTVFDPAKSRSRHSREARTIPGSTELTDDPQLDELRSAFGRVHWGTASRSETPARGAPRRYASPPRDGDRLDLREDGSTPVEGRGRPGRRPGYPTPSIPGWPVEPKGKWARWFSCIWPTGRTSDHCGTDSSGHAAGLTYRPGRTGDRSGRRAGNCGLPRSSTRPSRQGPAA